MKNIFIVFAVLALSGAALAAVNPARPMLTGHGNVPAAPGRIIITNQTAANPDETVKLGKFVVTGSLLRVNPARLMLTGHGNVNARPGRVIIANQTAPAADDIKLDKFVVTGSLLKP